MRLTWVIEGKGAGQADADTVEAAARALSDAVRAAYSHLGPDTLATMLPAVLGPLRAALVTDGRYSVERGQEWSTSLGGIFVTLYP